MELYWCQRVFYLIFTNIGTFLVNIFTKYSAILVNWQDVLWVTIQYRFFKIKKNSVFYKIKKACSYLYIRTGFYLAIKPSIFYTSSPFIILFQYRYGSPYFLSIHNLQSSLVLSKTSICLSFGSGVNSFL